MILNLDDVKLALGVTGDEQDESITSKINGAASFIEGQTRRRFDEPIAVKEYQYGSGSDKMMLKGHIDVAEADASSDDIAIYERVLFGEWELLDPTEYERRGDTVVRPFYPWIPTAEYRFEYNDGYSVAPADIQALALELVIGQYVADTALNDESTGITSETLVGVYSYTASANSVGGTASSPGGGEISVTGRATINSYRRQLV